MNTSAPPAAGAALRAPSLLEIERERALVTVEMHELAGQLAARRPAAERAQQVASRRLHLDDLGAVVGEVERRRRTDHHRGEIDDADAGERAAAHVAGPARRRRRR